MSEQISVTVTRPAGVFTNALLGLNMEYMLKEHNKKYTITAAIYNAVCISNI